MTDKLERLSVGRFDYDGLFTVVPTHNDAQYEGLRKLVEERNPKVIGINESDAWQHADGITANEKRRLIDALGPTHAAKIKSAEMLAVGTAVMPGSGSDLAAPDAVELAVEQGVGAPFTRPTGAAIGRVRDIPDAGSRYVTHLLASISQPLAGLRVVVDCAYGAASAVAPNFASLGLARMLGGQSDAARKHAEALLK